MDADDHRYHSESALYYEVRVLFLDDYLLESGIVLLTLGVRAAYSYLGHSDKLDCTRNRS